MRRDTSDFSKCKVMQKKVKFVEHNELKYLLNEPSYFNSIMFSRNIYEIKKYKNQRKSSRKWRCVKFCTLFRTLFWPSVRKISSLNLQTFEITRTICLNIETSKQKLMQNVFFCTFLSPNISEQSNFKLEKNNQDSDKCRKSFEK